MAKIATGKPPHALRVAATANAALRADPAIPSSLSTASLGTIVSIAADGRVLISVAGAAPVVALALIQITAAQLATAYATGAQVLVVAIDGDVKRPAIIGIIGSPAPSSSRRPTTAIVDGRRVELTGQDEVVLTCGKASITLTKAGKVIIKGTYVSSGSEGVNRLTGGSVQIN